MTHYAPLQDVFVIDFTHVLAGPACSYYLGLLGATIIKIESPHKGDAIRHRGGTDAAAADAGMSTAYVTQGGGKYAITLDLETDQDKAKLHALLRHADVFVENHIPDTLHRLGLDEEVLCKQYPQLIYCAMTGYGRGAPQANSPAYDVNIQAACGLMDATGTADSGPMRTGAPILDYATGLAAGFAVVTALYHKQRTNEGTFIDVSMLETGLSLMSSTVTDYLKTGHAPQRRGNLANSRSPGAGSFACQEGVLSLGVNEEAHFINLANGLACPEWLADPRFAERAARKVHATELAVLIEGELQKKPAGDWEAILQEAGVPCARLRSMPEALASDQVRNRGFVQDLPDGTKVPTLPFQMNKKGAFRPELNAPRLGQDNDLYDDLLAAMIDRKQ